MIQAEDLALGCRCPECGERCAACLGTNSVVSREGLKKLEDDPRFFVNPFENGSEDEPEYFSRNDGFGDYSD